MYGVYLYERGGWKLMAEFKSRWKALDYMGNMFPLQETIVRKIVDDSFDSFL